MGLSLDPMIAWLLRLALAGVFAQAAFHKVRDLDAASQIVADYRVTPTEWATFHAVAATLAEAFVAGALASSGFGAAGSGLALAGRLACVVAIALLALYSVAIGVNLARGRRDIDCGCLGPAGRSPRIGPWLIVRNAWLASAAAALVWLPPSTRPLYWLDYLSLFGGLVALVLVWVAIHVIAATAPLVESKREST
jgi:hypothetical protein